MGSLLTAEEIIALEKKAPSRPGVYFLFKSGELQYIGGTKNLNTRIYGHHCAVRYGNRAGNHDPHIDHDDSRTIECSIDDVWDLEAKYIKHLAPPFNFININLEA